MELRYNDETGVWEEAKEAYATLEIETEKDWNRLQEMVTYWKNHHDEEGNEI